jgi:antitoxin component of RelBE/YafQ-DinJ toxin-antitoxin module
MKLIQVKITDDLKAKAKELAVARGYGSVTTLVRLLLIQEIEKAEEAK